MTLVVFVISIDTILLYFRHRRALGFGTRIPTSVDPEGIEACTSLKQLEILLLLSSLLLFDLCSR